MTEPAKQPVFAAVCDGVETPERINRIPRHDPHSGLNRSSQVIGKFYMGLPPPNESGFD